MQACTHAYTHPPFLLFCSSFFCRSFSTWNVFPPVCPSACLSVCACLPASLCLCLWHSIGICESQLCFTFSCPKDEGFILNCKIHIRTHISLLTAIRSISLDMSVDMFGLTVVQGLWLERGRMLGMLTLMTSTFFPILYASLLFPTNTCRLTYSMLVLFTMALGSSSLPSHCQHLPMFSFVFQKNFFENFCPLKSHFWVSERV